MKYCLLMFAAVVLCGQSTNTTYTTDVNGNRVATATTESNSSETKLNHSINGKTVPFESSTETVLQDDANGRVTEKIVHKYDQSGNLATTERILTEETKLPDGGASTHATTFRTDLNGEMAKVEQQTIDSHPQGGGAVTNTVIERPTINGSFAPVEKRTLTTDKTAEGKSESEDVYRPDGNGQFYEALKYVTDEHKSGGQTVENKADYEPDATGRLQLHGQTITTTTKNSSGAEVKQVDLYEKNADGVAQDANALPRIKEEKIVVRQASANGGVTETLSVRTPSLANPGVLGPARQVSETVCTGKCEAAPKP